MNFKQQWCAVVVLVSVFVAGCGGQSKSPQVAESNTVSSNTAGNTVTLALEPNTVIIGYLPSLTLPQPLIGLQEGEFNRRINGVAFKDTVLPSNSAVLNALRSGTVDIAYTDAATAVKGYLAAKNLVLLGACASQADHTAAQQSPPQTSPLRSVYFTTKKFVQANPNFVRRFVEINRDITDDLNANPPKAMTRVMDAWSKASGKKPDVAAAKTAFKTIRFTSQADLRSLQGGALRQNSDLTGFRYNPTKP